MTKDKTSAGISRRTVLRNLATLGAAAAAPASLLVDASAAHAATKCHGTTPKSALQYQSKPKGSHSCSNCQLFCPGPSSTAMGTCKVVKGSISPKGWCSAWTPG